MTRRTTKHRAGVPAGAWRRFFTALTVLIVVLVGVPVLLIACSLAGLEAPHPFPAIGSTEEIKAFFQRDLTPTEVAPIALRALLIVGWLLWLGMALSVLASIFEARGSALRSWVPQFAMFAGLGRWIAAGLTAVSSLAPHFVSAASLASPRPFTISSVTPDQPVAVESPVAPGFARVQRGESIETFAQRLLGDATRWPELWELNKDQEVGPDGEVWTAPWKLGAGWDLRLPPDAVPLTPVVAMGVRRAAPAVDVPIASAWTRRENLAVVDEYEVAAGDSFWGIAERFLPAGSAERDVWEFTQALMTVNAPRLGYAHPAMLHPGDVVDIVAPNSTTAMREEAEEVTGAAGVTSSHTVVTGDSYWEIAEDALGADATPGAVLELSGELIDLNSPRLQYDDPRMIHPGDVVYIGDPESAVVPNSEPAVPESASVLTSDADALAIDELPLAPVAPVTTVLPPPTSTTTTSTLPPPSTPPPPSASDADADRGSPSSPIGIGQAALIATGIVALLVARRRAKLRAAEPPARVPLPNPDMVATERMLRRLDAGERLLRVDIALRAAAAELADGEQRIVVVRCAPDGTVEIHLSAAASLAGPWRGAERCWTMPGTVPVEELAASARSVGAPCIALTQIGVDDEEWDVLVDIEAAGLLAVDADADTADDVVRALAVGLASSEFAEVAHLVGVGIDEEAFLGHRHAQVVPTVDEAIELAATLIGSTTSTTRSTFSLRARHTSGEMWEPTVVVVATSHAADVSPAVVRSISTRGGLAIVVGAPVGQARWTLRRDGSMWTLDPVGIRLRPVGIDRAGLDDLDELIDDSSEPVVDDASPDEHVVVMDLTYASDIDTVAVTGAGNGHNGNEVANPAAMLYPERRDTAVIEYSDPPWSIMVRLLGNVEIVDREHRAARFERSKTLELVSWLVTHRGRASRSAARTALWDLDVRDATFANVVSEARRAMARHVPPPDGDEWLRRTMTDELSLHDEVIADADVVRARLERARAVGGDEAMTLLRPAVELINELPFTGTGYLWPDSEGITSNLVLLATNVTAEYAKLALAGGDVDGVFWSTGRGLQVLAGQEALIALRMRAHAEAGDLSAVRLEWEAYERVINADPWSDGEPAPKLVALRKQLLAH
jgi:nucleoid-associated protein YgaU